VSACAGMEDDEFGGLDGSSGPGLDASSGGMTDAGTEPPSMTDAAPPSTSTDQLIFLGTQGGPAFAMARAESSAALVLAIA